MKTFFASACLLFLILQSFAQYIPADSARKLMLTATTPKEKFFAYFNLDRYYYTNGLYDSSVAFQKELFAIANSLKNDSLLAVTYRAIGNRYLAKTDYNFALNNYITGLTHAKDNYQRGRMYGAMAYIYAVMENDSIALSYLKKSEGLIDPSGIYFLNIFYGVVYNNLREDDSALSHLRKADDAKDKNPDPLITSLLLGQTGRAYELKGDHELAEVYYKKAIAYCKKENLPFSLLRHGKLYCDFLLHSGNYPEAKQIAKEILDASLKSSIPEGMSVAADILRNVYTHFAEKDSALYYAQMQITYKDSVTTQKSNAEFQNLTFNQQLKEIGEQVKTKEEETQRKQNLQYALIALGIITFIILFLLLSRRVITNIKTIEFLSVLALLIVFEFLNLFLHPFLERITNHSPVLMLLALVCIAALLVPLHHRIEKWAKLKLVEKNKQVRLAAAKKTIAKLEGEQK